MAKLKVSTREIGSVRVFDLEGSPTQETLQSAAWRIQRNIRRFRLQRVILNLQRVPHLDPLGVRKLLAACIRPQKSLIFGASSGVLGILETSYIPRNVRVCENESQVTEDLGPFLIEKDVEKEFLLPHRDPDKISPGKDLERRRAKRSHVALSIQLKIYQKEGEPIVTKAIATNISEGGLFAEYLDLEAAQVIEKMESLQGLKTDIHVFSNANFLEEHNLKGELVRKELRKKQLGVAVLLKG